MSNIIRRNLKRGGIMPNVKTTRKILILVILIVFNMILVSSKMVAEKEDSLKEIETRLMDISENERGILDFLFIQTQEIEELEKEKDKTFFDIYNMKKEIGDLDRKIQKETINYEDRLDILKQVLISYQRMGAVSFIEIVLDADGISSLIRRINTLRDLTKNTGDLLESIHRLKEQLLAAKSNLDEKLILLEEKEGQLARTIKEKEKKVQEMEQYLASLKGDREYYQEQLNSIMEMMDELAFLIGDVSKKFTHIIREGDLPEDKVEFKLTGKGIKGIIKEEVFNEIIKDNPTLPEIILRFHSNMVEMEFPSENLLLFGSFHILGNQTIRFQVEEGNFYGFLLKKSTIDEFLKEGDFILDLEPLLGKNTIEHIEIMEDYIELTVGIRLF